MNIEWINNDKLVVSQSIQPNEKYQIAVSLCFDDRDFGLKQLPEKQYKKLISRHAIHTEADSLLTSELSLDTIFCQANEWDKTLSIKVAKWTRLFQGSVKKACLQSFSDMDYHQIQALIWQIDRILIKFDTFFAKYQAALKSRKKLVVIAYQELIKLYERIMTVQEKVSSQILYAMITKLADKLSDMNTTEAKKKEADQLTESDSDIMSAWTPYRGKVIAAKEHKTLNMLFTIALSSMFVMAFVTVISYYLRQSIQNLTFSMIIAVCLIYAVRDVVKELLKHKITTILGKLNPFRTFSLVDPQTRVCFGSRKTASHVEPMPAMQTYRHDAAKSNHAYQLQVIDNMNIKSGQFMLYTETHINLKILSDCLREKHFRILNDKGDTQRSVMQKNSELILKVKVKKKGQLAVKRQFICQFADNNDGVINEVTDQIPAYGI